MADDCNINLGPDAVIEVRAYYIRDGRRDEFAKLFQEKTVAQQETCGMKILGQYLSLKDTPDNTPGDDDTTPPANAPFPQYFFDDNYFVWLRAFPNLEERERMKEAFYTSAEWLAIEEQIGEMLDNEKSMVWVVKLTG